MAAEVEQAGGWIEIAWKALSAVVLPLIGWMWRNNVTTIEHRAAVKARLEAVENDVDSLGSAIRRIDGGVNRILNHLTGTNLHGGED